MFTTVRVKTVKGYTVFPKSQVMQRASTEKQLATLVHAGDMLKFLAVSYICHSILLGSKLHVVG